MDKGSAGGAVTGMEWNARRLVSELNAFTFTGFGPCMSADFPCASCQLSHTSPHSISQPRRPALTGSVKGNHSTNTIRYLCVSSHHNTKYLYHRPPTLHLTNTHRHRRPSFQPGNVIISHVTAPLDQTLSSKRAPFAIHQHTSNPRSSLPPFEHVLAGG
jgi:hypothetical protein